MHAGICIVHLYCIARSYTCPQFTLSCEIGKLGNQSVGNMLASANEAMLYLVTRCIASMCESYPGFYGICKRYKDEKKLPDFCRKLARQLEKETHILYDMPLEPLTGEQCHYCGTAVLSCSCPAPGFCVRPFFPGDSSYGSNQQMSVHTDTDLDKKLMRPFFQRYRSELDAMIRAACAQMPFVPRVG